MQRELPPPFLAVAATGVAVAVDRACCLGSRRRAQIAAPFCAAGAGLIASAVAAMFRKKTSPDPRKKDAALVVEGSFRLTRNPIYLGFSLIQLGIGIGSGRTPVALSAPATILVLEALVIPREEARLAASFGSAYREYCEQVPRWPWLRARAGAGEPVDADRREGREG